MKLILYYFLTLIFLVACQDKKQTGEETSEVTIKYSTTINGYNVSARWRIKRKIRDENGAENLSGPAILTFEKIDTKEIFWVIHPEFSVNIDKENLKYIVTKDGEFVKNQSFTQISNYIKPKFEKVGTTEKEEGSGYTYIPFFFQDVDFDNKKELILTYASTKTKGGSENKIFKISDYDGLEFSEMTYEPFTNFTGFYYGNPSADAYRYTTIDYKNRTIIQSGLVGVGGQYKTIYEFKKSQDGEIYQLLKKTNINTNMVDYGRTDGITETIYNNNGDILNINKSEIQGN